jgi:hypothetical protein
MRADRDQEDLSLLRAIRILRAAGHKIGPGAGVAMVWLDDEQLHRQQSIARAGIEDDFRSKRNDVGAALER